MTKILGTSIALALFGLLLFQVQSVLAGEGNHGKPVTSPVTSPVTGPTTCKPGWGFGDTNHCHSGPPGLVGKNHSNKGHH